jgi:selenium metabolism protein YedF
MTVDNDLLLLITSSGLGDGEPDLGEKLMGAFLTQLLETGPAPARVIFMNSGVFLTTEGSAVLPQLSRLEALGSELLSCGTCLEYYGRKEQLVVGRPTNMRDTVEALRTFGRVLRP